MGLQRTLLPDSCTTRAHATPATRWALVARKRALQAGHNGPSQTSSAFSRTLLELHPASCPLLQEFVELVRAGKMLEAITYARQHLAQWAGSHMQELQVTTLTDAARPPSGDWLRLEHPRPSHCLAGCQVGQAAVPAAASTLLHSSSAASRQVPAHCCMEAATLTPDKVLGALPSLQTVVALLAFRAETECKPYQELFQLGRWDALITLFYRELYKLNNLTPQSLLNIHLQASACPDHCSKAWLVAGQVSPSTACQGREHCCHCSCLTWTCRHVIQQRDRGRAPGPPSRLHCCSHCPLTASCFRGRGHQGSLLTLLLSLRLLQAGLSALKTPNNQAGDSSKQDPMHLQVGSL